MRLYAALLNEQPVAYTEAAGLRAPSQAGFRPATSALHAVFTLPHLLDRERRLRRPLVCRFLYLQGPYDRVPRLLLGQALARLGVTAPCWQPFDRCTPTRWTSSAWAGEAALACRRRAASS